MPTYSTYGLVFRSDIDLPGLTRIDTDSIDVEISAGHISDDAGGPNEFRNWQAGPGRFFSVHFGVGRVLVTDGNSILYDREDGVADDQIASIILGSCFAAVLMQRKLLPFHACSVLTDKGAVLVVGVSGAGKSTLLGGFLELGLPMMADDVTALDFDAEGHPLAIPGFPAIRLWADSLKKLGHSSEGLAAVRSDLEKYYLPISNHHADPVRIRAMATLNAHGGDDVEVSQIEPARRVETLSRFIFRKNFIDGMEMRRFAFSQAAKTADKITMLDVKRPRAGLTPKLLAQAVLNALEEAESPAS